MTHGFDVVAVGIAQEGAVVVRVVLGPDAGLVEDLGTAAGRPARKASTAARSGAVKAMWDSRKPSPVVRGPSQKSGIGGTPYPMTSPKSRTRVPPMVASTVS